MGIEKLNHNKQKCKMFPNDNQVNTLPTRVSGLRERLSDLFDRPFMEGPSMGVGFASGSPDPRFFDLADHKAAATPQMIRTPSQRETPNRDGSGLGERGKTTFWVDRTLRPALQPWAVSGSEPPPREDS